VSDESTRALLETAVRAALEAGKVTLRHFQTDLVRVEKPDGTPVTIADCESEAALRRVLGARYPRHAILGEEEGESNAGASFRWIVDPLDGTRSFVRGSPLYGVLVGLEREGEPLLGVIHAPALGETVAAAKGLGCTWNGRPCRVSTITDLRRGLLLATTFRNYGAKTPAFERVATAVGMARTWGDCYGYVLVATGRAEVMIDPVMNVWDCAALLPILEEAGGTFTTWAGERTIRGGEAIATNGVVYDEVMRLVAGAS
jgi:histidinol-phosphatase